MKQAPSSLPTFAFSGLATILHLNIRKDGPDDEKALAVDVKMQGTVNGRRACEYFDAGLYDFLFDESKIIRNTMLEPIGFANVIENAELSIAGIEFASVKLQKFKVQAKKDGGVVLLTFSAAITPNGSDVAIISEYMADEVDVIARMAPGLFDGAAAPKPKAPPASQPDLLTVNVGDDDALLEQARSLVITSQRASVSAIQRHLRIGYNRAARLLEALEAEGVVSAMNSDGVRTVLDAPTGADA